MGSKIAEGARTFKKRDLRNCTLVILEGIRLFPRFNQIYTWSKTIGCFESRRQQTRQYCQNAAEVLGRDWSKKSLNKYRFSCFAKSATKSKVMLQSLPTEDAAEKHSFRVYHQIQVWLGNPKNPEEWGWEMENGHLSPVKTNKAPAPDSLLKTIFCNCAKTKSCDTMACGCRKIG